MLSVATASGMEFHLRFDRDDMLAAEATDGDPREPSTNGLIVGAKLAPTVHEQLRALTQLAERVDRAQKGRVA